MTKGETERGRKGFAALTPEILQARTQKARSAVKRETPDNKILRVKRIQNRKRETRKLREQLNGKSGEN